MTLSASCLSLSKEKSQKEKIDTKTVVSVMFLVSPYRCGHIYVEGEQALPPTFRVFLLENNTIK
jgi:hypothetical protein